MSVGMRGQSALTANIHGNDWHTELKQMAYRGLMPADNDPGSDGAVDTSQVIQEPRELLGAQGGLHVTKPR